VPINQAAPSEAVVVCPFCGSSDLTGETVSNRFVYMRCTKCELVSCVPREIPIEEPLTLPQPRAVFLDRLASWLRSFIGS